MNQKDIQIKLLQIMNQAKDLPALPTTACKVMEFINDSAFSMRGLSSIISSDQAITSKLLKMVNSAYYGFPRRMSTISNALVVVGVNELRNLILGISVKPIYRTELGEKLWQHSITSAVGAKIIAQKYTDVNAEEAFIVGLLHDCGKLVLLQHFPDVFEKFIADELDFDEAIKQEKEIFGYNHCEVGAKIATKWNLPKQIIEAIKFHHRPDIKPKSHLVTVAYIADCIAHYSKTKLDDPSAGSLSNYINNSFVSNIKFDASDEAIITKITTDAREFNEIFI